jgi:hypothetical protein
MDDRSAPHVIERALDAPRIPVEAFLTSRAGGLGLDVACDAATREAMQRALTELAITPVQALRGRRRDAEDFDRLFSDDPVKDLGRKTTARGELHELYSLPRGDGPLHSSVQHRPKRLSRGIRCSPRVDLQAVRRAIFRGT